MNLEADIFREARAPATAPRSTLRELYDALQGLKEQEQAALAEAHADDAKFILGF